MIMLKNYFKSTPKNVKRWLLALKGFIGTIALASYIQDNPRLSCIILVLGAVIDFILNATFSEEQPKD